MLRLARIAFALLAFCAADAMAQSRNGWPSPAMLDGIDTMVVDLQDIGARFYTYPATMAYVMEEAARRKIAVVVLDRPRRVP